MSVDLDGTGAYQTIMYQMYLVIMIAIMAQASICNLTNQERANNGLPAY